MSAGKLKALVVDLDWTLVHVYPKSHPNAIPAERWYRKVETPLYVIYINHKLVDLIKTARRAGVKTVLWTTDSEKHMNDILQAADLEWLFDLKLDTSNSPRKKTIRSVSEELIPRPAVIIDDMIENVDGNALGEYLVVNDFMLSRPSDLELKYSTIYNRL